MSPHNRAEHDPRFGPSLKKALINIQKGVFDDASLKVVKNAVNKGNGDALTILRGALTSATTGGTVASKGDMMGQFFRKKNVDWMTNEEAMIAAFGVKPEALGAAGKSSPLQSLKNWASGM